MVSFITDLNQSVPIDTLAKEFRNPKINNLPIVDDKALLWRTKMTLLTSLNLLKVNSLVINKYTGILQKDMEPRCDVASIAIGKGSKYRKTYDGTEQVLDVIRNTLQQLVWKSLERFC